MLATLAMTGLLTFAFPDELRVDYGKVHFGSERPEFRDKTKGLRFRICDVAKEDGGYRVCGFRHVDERRSAEVWSAHTEDGITFTDAHVLYRLPPPERAWLAGDLAIVESGQVIMLICELGKPARSGHPFHVFSGGLDGTGWKKRNGEPVYLGQDAFRLVWDPASKRLVNYQTTYQKWPKRYPDNMGDSVRRVLHIRTSPDGIVWTPGGSFGVDGPHLPADQLIVPDAQDPAETEFYKLQAVDFDGFWAGCVTRYISQPAGLPRSGGLPHGPFLDCEWWTSRNGIDWQRPCRDTSDFADTPYGVPYFMHPPITVGDEWRFTAAGKTYAWKRSRLFYFEAKANVEVTTIPFTIDGDGLALHASFESVRRNLRHHLGSGYLMAELRTPDDLPMPGFEKEKCTILPSAQTEHTLSWQDQSLPKGKVRLKLYLRSMRVYSLSH